MIKAVVLDVDGVVIGTKKGFNFPNPHPNVVQKIKEIQNTGIRISLCSSNPAYTNKELVTQLGLNSLHIGSNGMEMFNPVEQFYTTERLPKDICLQIAKKALNKGIYLEVFTPNSYYIQQEREYTKVMNVVRRKHAEKVENLLDVISMSDITRMSLVVAVEEKENIIQLLKPFDANITINWSTAPQLPNILFAVLSLKHISKKSAVMEISKFLQIPLEYILGVGDGVNDWNFIELCGYGAAMGNAHHQLKEYIKTKGPDGYVGGHVDENGLVDILDHFLQ